MEHVNHNSRVTDPDPDPWAIELFGEEKEEGKKKGSLESGLSYRESLNESQGGRADATVK